MSELNVLLAGVGGQGVVLLSELLGDAAVSQGLRVRGSEVLGMAVRGGRVSSVVRLGDDVEGPLVPDGRVDLVVALEPVEALPASCWLAPDGVVVVNTHAVVPFTVSLGRSSYPPIAEILERLRRVASQVVALDADALAVEAGSRQAANVVMLGAAFGVVELPVDLGAMNEAIERRFSGQLAALNRRAFERGRELGEAARQSS